MLRSFEGHIDASGLCSLRQNDGDSGPLLSANLGRTPAVPFWAVIDTADATNIIRELLSGNRRRALVLLEEAAVTLGSKLG